jgi:hypothetical protein
MNKKKKSDVVDDLIHHFRTSMIEAMNSAGVEKAMADKTIKYFQKINQDEYRYIRRILDSRKAK